jgi:hypothetical protein
MHGYFKVQRKMQVKPRTKHKHVAFNWITLSYSKHSPDKSKTCIFIKIDKFEVIVTK